MFYIFNGLMAQFRTYVLNPKKETFELPAHFLHLSWGVAPNFTRPTPFSFKNCAG